MILIWNFIHINPWWKELSGDNILFYFIYFFVVLCLWKGVVRTFYFACTQPTITCSKLKNKNSRTMYDIGLKLTINTPERRQWRCSGLFIVNFEQVSYLTLMFLFLTSSRNMLAGVKGILHHRVSSFSHLRAVSWSLCHGWINNIARIWPNYLAPSLQLTLSNDLVVRTLGYQSRGPSFKRTTWL